jgi:two-component system, cell cycle response regulator
LAQSQIEAGKKTGDALCLFFIDVNGLKKINDTLGHKVGDAALVDCAQSLKQTFRSADLIARLGGDEFVVMAANCPPLHGEKLSTRLLLAMRTESKTQARAFILSASIGVTSIEPHDTKPLVELLESADLKMYADKKSGQYAVPKE